MKKRQRPWRSASAPIAALILATLGFEASLTNAQVPVNDTCPMATVIGDGIFAGDGSMAGSEGDTLCTPVGVTEGPDVWYKYTAPGAGTVNFNTKRLGPTILSLHSGCPGTSGNELACNSVIGGLSSSVGLTMAAGQMVWVRVAAASPFELEVGPAASLIGRIEDASDGSGITGALAILALQGLSVWALPVAAAPDGTYSIVGLPPGVFLAGVRDGSGSYVSEVFADHQIPAIGIVDSAAGSPVTLSAGVTTTLDFALERAGRIAGRVTEIGSGIPLGNVHVTVFDIYGTPWSSANTLGDGTYDIGGLRSGTYYLRATKHGTHLRRLYPNRPCPGACNPTQGGLVAVVAGSTTTGIHFELEPRLDGTLAGRVTDGTTGLQEAVRFSDAKGSFVASALPDANGDYVDSDLEPGTYFVGAGASGDYYIGEIYDGGTGLRCQRLLCDPTQGMPVVVPNGGTVTGIDFDLELGGAIDGTIVTPFSTDVHVFDAAGELVASSAFPSGSGGGFPVVQIPAGNYNLVAGRGSPFYIPELYDGGSGFPCINCDTTQGQIVGVTPGVTTSGIHFELASGGGISGRLRRVGTDLIPDASRASIFDSSGEFVASAEASLYGYETTGLLPGDYTIIARSDSPSIVEELYVGELCGSLCEPQNGTLVTVSGTDIHNDIDFDLAPCPDGKPPSYAADNHIDIVATIETCVDMRVVEGFHVAATGRATLLSPVVVFEGGRVEGELSVGPP